MILFESVRWKNIFSYGNTWTEISLNRSPTTLITGANGDGKSVLLEALSLGLFGKPFRRINKTQVVNVKNNSNALIEIKLKDDQDEVLIRRGIKPDIFEVYVNGVLQNQPGNSRQYQQELENNILGFDYTIFTQIIVIGKATHISFMRLDPTARRKFVEGILKMTVFGRMALIHSTRLSEAKTKFLEVKNACETLKDRITVRKRYVSDLQTQMSSHKEKLGESIQAEVDQYESEIKALSEYAASIPQIDFNPSKAADRKDALAEVQHMIRSAEGRIRSCADKIKKTKENTVCHACGQNITAETIADHLSELEKQLEHEKEALLDIIGSRDRLQEEVAGLVKTEQQWKDAQTALRDTEVKIEILNGNIAATKRRAESDDTNQLVESIADAEKEISSMEELLQKIIETRTKKAVELEVMMLMTSILKDNGIKASIIRRFIPVINYTINQNLNKLGFFAKFTLDEEFDETIQARGIDTMSYNNFSEGEKLRIDMAILLAWREIARTQNNVATNLLVFDEMFDSSMDEVGSEALAILLSHLKDSNIFIISHNPKKISDYMRSQISFHKVDGFSRMKT